MGWLWQQQQQQQARWAQSLQGTKTLQPAVDSESTAEKRSAFPVQLDRRELKSNTSLSNVPSPPPTSLSWPKHRGPWSHPDGNWERRRPLLEFRTACRSSRADFKSITCLKSTVKSPETNRLTKNTLRILTLKYCEDDSVCCILRCYYDRKTEQPGFARIADVKTKYSTNWNLLLYYIFSYRFELK